MTFATPLHRASKPVSSLLVILTFLMLSGCGQKGALYLPEADLPDTVSSTETKQPQSSDVSPQNPNKKDRSTQSAD